MILKQLPRSCGENRVKENSMNVSTGLTDVAGSCARELFECDLQFAKDTFANKEVFNNDYHAFWSTTGFDNRLEESCPSGGTNPVEHQCCGGVDAPWYWI